MKKNKLWLLFVAMGLLSVSLLVTASDTFIISTIEVRGNTRTDVGTVLNYLPVKSGDAFDVRADTGRSIRALYETGLFDDISLHRNGDTLIVELSERPVIATIDIEGNEKIDDDALEESLRNEGIFRGRVFNRSVLETVQRELRRLYASAGNYSMRMETTVEKLERNRVAISINISEGKVATIRHINIVGNTVFDDDELLDLLESGLESSNPFSSADEYSRIKLEGDLEILRSYYLDRGYINFTISSTQVSISADKKAIYVTINIEEGERYTINQASLSGDFSVPRAELESLLEFSAGDTFSRQNVIRTRDAIIDRLGEDSYAFANVNVSTDIEPESNAVDITFFIDAGKRVYINRIVFTGHSGTSDYVFRREMRLVEGGRYSPKHLDRSRIRLQRLAFISEVNVETSRVVGSDDLIDIYIHLQEGASGSFTVGLGVGSNGLIFNAGISQDNFLGTGNRVSFNVNNSRSNRQLSAEYGESFYTVDGISRTINAFLRERDATEITSTTDFVADSYGLGLRYGIPLTEFSSMSAGFNFTNTQITATAGTSNEIRAELSREGNDFDIFTVDLSYAFDDRNRTVFAETGSLHRISLSVAVPGSDSEFYKLGYRLEYYYPLTKKLVFSLNNRTDFGDGYGSDQEQLPFFERFFAGGVRSLRGYRQGSLGPRDSTNDAAGGDFRFLNTIELIFPPTFSDIEGQTRASFFTDFGNVYNDIDNFRSSEFRATYGFSFVWLAPIGPLTFSLARPYQSEPGDSLQTFQFTLGSVF